MSSMCFKLGYLQPHILQLEKCGLITPAAGSSGREFDFKPDLICSRTLDKGFFNM